jgi:hypothetical protein
MPLHSRGCGRWHAAHFLIGGKLGGELGRELTSKNAFVFTRLAVLLICLPPAIDATAVERDKA